MAPPVPRFGQPYVPKGSEVQKRRDALETIINNLKLFFYGIGITEKDLMIRLASQVLPTGRTKGGYTSGMRHRLKGRMACIVKASTSSKDPTVVSFQYRAYALQVGATIAVQRAETNSNISISGRQNFKEDAEFVATALTAGYKLELADEADHPGVQQKRDELKQSLWGIIADTMKTDPLFAFDPTSASFHVRATGLGQHPVSSNGINFAQDPWLMIGLIDIQDHLQQLAVMSEKARSSPPGSDDLTATIELALKFVKQWKGNPRDFTMSIVELASEIETRTAETDIKRRDLEQDCVLVVVGFRYLDHSQAVKNRIFLDIANKIRLLKSWIDRPASMPNGPRNFEALVTAAGRGDRVDAAAAPNAAASASSSAPQFDAVTRETIKEMVKSALEELGWRTASERDQDQEKLHTDIRETNEKQREAGRPQE